MPLRHYGYLLLKSITSLFVSYVRMYVPIRLWLDQVFFYCSIFRGFFSISWIYHLNTTITICSPSMSSLSRCWTIYKTATLSPFACIYFIIRPCFPFIFAVIEYKIVNLSQCFSSKNKKSYYSHLSLVSVH